MRIRMLRGVTGATDDTGSRSKFYEEGAMLTVGVDVPFKVAGAFLSIEAAEPHEDAPKAEKGPPENKMLDGPAQNKGGKHQQVKHPGRPRKE